MKMWCPTCKKVVNAADKICPECLCFSCHSLGRSVKKVEEAHGWESWVDLAVKVIEKKEPMNKKVDRLKALLLDYANRLDGNDQCVACNAWVSPMDGMLDVEGIICNKCGLDEKGGE